MQIASLLIAMSTVTVVSLATANPEATKNANAPVEQVPSAANMSATEDSEQLSEKPWKKGVDSETRAAVMVILQEANELFAAHRCAQAIPKYREAIELWNHPALTYNLAICLIDVGGDAVEIYEQLLASIRFGPAPLGPAPEGPERFQNAKRYFGLLERQVGRLVVECKQPGVAISLDGKPLLVGPGSKEVVTSQGVRQLLAEGEGFVTTTYRVDVQGGAIKTAVVNLARVGALERPFSSWIPISTTTGGALLVGAGVLLSTLSQRNADRFDKAVVAECGEGCDDSQLMRATRDLRSRANTQETLAVAGYIIGSVAVVTGITLFVLNRPRRPKDKQSVWLPVATQQGLAWRF